MKKHLRSLLAACLAVCLCVCFGLFAAACKDDNGGNNNNGGEEEGSIVSPPAETVEVTSVTLDENVISLEVDEDKKLTATVNPDDATDKTVAWKSSKEEVATVSNDGTVTAVAAGYALITATAGEKSAYCLVNVADSEQEAPVATVLEVGYNQLTVSENSISYKLDVEIAGNYTFTVSTVEDNEFIVVVGNKTELLKDGGTFEVALSKGEVAITVIAGDDNESGNLGLDIVSQTKPLGYEGMIQVSSRVNSDAITAGYLVVPVAVLEAGDYTITGGVTGGEVTVYMNNYPVAIGSSEDGALNIDLSGDNGILEDDLDANGAVTFKFDFTVTNAGSFVFWARVEAVEDENGDESDGPLTLNMGSNSIVIEDGDEVDYVFTPSETGWYKISSTNADSYAIAWDYSMYGNGVNGFEIVEKLEEGETYVITFTTYNWDSATYTVTVEATEEPEEEEVVAVELQSGVNNFDPIVYGEPVTVSFTGEAGKDYKFTVSMSAGDWSCDDVTFMTNNVTRQADDDGKITLVIGYVGWDDDSGAFTITVAEA